MTHALSRFRQTLYHCCWWSKNPYLWQMRHRRSKYSKSIKGEGVTAHSNHQQSIDSDPSSLLLPWTHSKRIHRVITSTPFPVPLFQNIHQSHHEDCHVNLNTTSNTRKGNDLETTTTTAAAATATIPNQEVHALPENEVQHLSKVLRVKEDEPLWVCYVPEGSSYEYLKRSLEEDSDDTAMTVSRVGTWYPARFASSITRTMNTSKKKSGGGSGQGGGFKLADAETIRECALTPPRAYPIILEVGITKPANFMPIIGMATALGVETVVPIIPDNSSGKFSLMEIKSSSEPWASSSNLFESIIPSSTISSSSPSPSTSQSPKVSAETLQFLIKAQKCALEAMKQCGRAWPLRILPPRKLMPSCDNHHSEVDGGGEQQQHVQLRLAALEPSVAATFISNRGDNIMSISEAMQQMYKVVPKSTSDVNNKNEIGVARTSFYVQFTVGSEGGWSSREIELLKGDDKVVPVTLGKYILRSEIAVSSGIGAIIGSF